uniref:Uncharacterized protein n=1 Tax=Compsopogon caeruleus TaxID=31354 RepID=A0A7S1XF11_9RHOD|mmetsp:Transcript_2018/g.3595  ORF Transcript_2018/g.3595 Transcript_2018/m.3595 type:complete len:167 (+) Transcript_2018:158-658(+)
MAWIMNFLTPMEWREWEIIDLGPIKDLFMKRRVVLWVSIYTMARFPLIRTCSGQFQRLGWVFLYIRSSKGGGWTMVRRFPNQGGWVWFPNKEIISEGKQTPGNPLLCGHCPECFVDKDMPWSVKDMSVGLDEPPDGWCLVLPKSVGSSWIATTGMIYDLCMVMVTI